MIKEKRRAYVFYNIIGLNWALFYLFSFSSSFFLPSFFFFSFLSFYFNGLFSVRFKCCLVRVFPCFSHFFLSFLPFLFVRMLSVRPKCCTTGPFSSPSLFFFISFSLVRLVSVGPKCSLIVIFLFFFFSSLLFLLFSSSSCGLFRTIWLSLSWTLFFFLILIWLGCSLLSSIMLWYLVMSFFFHFSFSCPPCLVGFLFLLKLFN